MGEVVFPTRFRSTPCPKPGCGGDGCDIVGCAARAATRAAALASLPGAMVEALDHGAVHGVADLPDLADQPFGAIASRAVAGFAAGLGLGWVLVSRDGAVVPLDDLRLAADELARRAVLPPEADAWDGEDDAAC